MQSNLATIPINQHAVVEFTILMPCLNESETIATCIRKAHVGIKKAGISAEVLIADNGSTDGSQAIAKANGARVIDVEQRGYGSALRAGINAAYGKWVIMGDADDSYDFSSIDKFVDQLRDGNDLVMGCRMPRGGGKIMPGAMPWKHRWIGNPVLTFIGKLFFVSEVDDFHCGLRGGSKIALVDLNLNTPGMEFASEMVIKSKFNNLKTAQVPITLHPDGRSGQPHLRSWRDGWRHLRFMLLFSPRWLFLYPGMMLLMFGMVGSAWLVNGPKQIGSVILDIHTLVYFLFSIVLGLQATFFGVLTKSFATQEGLLPSDKLTKTIHRWFNLETGLMASGLLVLLGTAGSVAALINWRQADYGLLDPSSTMRLVLPSVLSLILGVQLFFNSFFFSALKLVQEKNQTS